MTETLSSPRTAPPVEPAVIDVPPVAAQKPISPVPIYVGVGLVVLGLALLTFTWGTVAAETEVWRQLPYVVSGGFGGLAAVLIGVTVVNVASKRADAVARERQNAQLTETLRELREAIEGDLP
jgi:hypothetical protein